jgi:hypothetical protein
MIAANYCNTLVCTPVEQSLIDNDIMIQNQERDLKLREGSVPTVGSELRIKSEGSEPVDLPADALDSYIRLVCFVLSVSSHLSIYDFILNLCIFSCFVWRMHFVITLIVIYLSKHHHHHIRMKTGVYAGHIARVQSIISRTRCSVRIVDPIGKALDRRTSMIGMYV